MTMMQPSFPDELGGVSRGPSSGILIQLMGTREALAYHMQLNPELDALIDQYARGIKPMKYSLRLLVHDKAIEDPSQLVTEVGWEPDAGDDTQWRELFNRVRMFA